MSEVSKKLLFEHPGGNTPTYLLAVGKENLFQLRYIKRASRRIASRVESQ